MPASALHHRTIVELARGFRSGEFSPVDLAVGLLERIDALDGTLGAFQRVCPERALSAAQESHAAIARGMDHGPLHGIPYVAKDLFDIRGLPTTAGSRLLADNVAETGATVIQKLEAAGMVLLGKTRTVQFAYGGAGINTDQGTPHNPWHQVPHLPGGSSSGTAVAVASGLAPCGLGTDTGGSVRIPASFCGLTGLKTTVGQVSRTGVWPLSESLDSVGPLARTAEDVALIYRAIQGIDPLDESTLHGDAREMPQELEPEIRGLRIAFGESAFFDDADPEVVQAVRACGRVFEELGAGVDSIEFEEARAASELNPRGMVIAAEAYANNRRLLEEHYDELDPVVAFRMIEGRDVPAHEYLRTKREWKRLRARAEQSLRDVDALLCPTVMIPAPELAGLSDDLERYAAVNLQCLRNTSIGNLLDLCALAIPCGFASDGLPIGLTIYGKPFDEDIVLRVGHAFQRATDWHERTPDLDWAGSVRR